MNHWNKDKLSPEELKKEIETLKRLVFAIYSKLPPEEKNVIFQNFASSHDPEDRDAASLLNVYR
ncbi:hypothetical protein PROVRETT_06022 [Providencia rettgeri DSM 1131]|uniref:hypothetical protein n=1 Tax=Providencia TaxID=586 RepID=UPI000197CA1A|nr:MULTISPECIES: hypothetical protein [Providencia]EFE55313.1 hypothetical protein PROVRETT_06022 [Providencia rettgeri DSM 1131]QXA59644.1 hypothetical protein I6L79_09140 [Providencia rettgeri]